MRTYTCDNCGEPDATFSCPIGSRHGDSIIIADFCELCHDSITERDFAAFALRNPAKFGRAVAEQARTDVRP